MREDDTLGFLHELDHLELELLTLLGLSTIFLSEMLRSSETFTTFVQSDNGTLIHHLSDLTHVNTSRSVEGLIGIPRIVFELLVTKAQTTILLIDFEHYNVDFLTNLSEL